MDLASADFAFPPSLPAKSVVRQRGEGVMVTVVVAEVVWRRSWSRQEVVVTRRTRPR